MSTKRFLPLPVQIRKISEFLEIKFPIAWREFITEPFGCLLLETIFNAEKNAYEIFIPQKTWNGLTDELKIYFWTHALCRIAMSEKFGTAFADSLYKDINAEASFFLRRLTDVWVSDFMKEKYEDIANRMFSEMVKNMHKNYAKTMKEENGNKFISLNFLFLMSTADRVFGNGLASGKAIDLILKHGLIDEEKSHQEEKKILNLTKIALLSDFISGMEKLHIGYIFAYYQFEECARAIFSILNVPYYPEIKFKIGGNGKNYEWTIFSD